MLGWAVIAVRLLVLAATLVLFGATAFFSYGLPPRGIPFANRQITWPRVLALIAAGTALFASLLWLVLEAATLGGSSADALNTGELWLLITQTHFGQIGAFRCVLLVFILAMLAALNRPEEFELHFRGALRNGCTLEELKETLLQIAVYCGMPAGVASFRIAKKVLAEHSSKSAD